MQYVAGMGRRWMGESSTVRVQRRRRERVGYRRGGSEDKERTRRKRYGRKKGSLSVKRKECQGI